MSCITEEILTGVSMKRIFLLGFDAGGSSGRCLLVNAATGEELSAKRSWSPLPSGDASGMAFDLDLDAIWDALGETCREVMQRSGANPEEVAGIAITSMRHSTVVLDKKDNVLLAAPNVDARSVDVCAELMDEQGGKFYRTGGHWPMPIFTAARLKWLAEHVPQDFAKSRVVLTLSEWITYRLCGVAAADPSHAGETMLYDLQKRGWSWDLIHSLGLPKYIFPKIADGGKRLGKLKADAARHLGLKPGIPVALGGGDTQCGLLGSGATESGHLGIVAGTTVPLQLVLGSLVIDPQAHLWTGQHVLSKQYVLESNAGNLGESLDWIAHVLYADALQPLAMLDAEAAQSSPGAHGLLSSFGSQIFDCSNMTLPFGYLALSPMIASHDPARRKHVARAILEGMAYGIKANADQLIQVSGLPQPAYGLMGGISRSLIWRQIISDVLNAPLSVTRLTEASALGAAICAGVGAGVFSNLSEGSAALTGEPVYITPNPEAAEIYAEIYEGWLQLRTSHTEADMAASSILMRGMSSPDARVSERGKSTFRPSMLVTAPMDETALARLHTLGEVTYQNYRETYNVLIGEALVEALQGKQVLVTEVDVVDVDALSKLPDLRLVASCRGNAVNIDAAACTAFGVPLINTPGRNADAVADLTLAFMLMLARKLAPAVQFLHDPEGEAGDLARMGLAHSQFEGVELWRKTIGLIGMGAVGKGVIRRLLPFGARVLVYDPYISPEQAVLAGAESVSLTTLLKASDFVSLHAAVTPETTGMLGEMEFGMMKPGTFLINTARAALLDENALAQALQSGHLAGAALDVFSAEPPGPDDPLLRLPNVLATPHLGGNTIDVSAHQGEMVADDLRRILLGERPHYLVNPETLEDFSWTRPHRVPSAEILAQLRNRGGPAISDLDVKPAKQSAPEIQILETSKPTLVEKGSQVNMNQIDKLEKILSEFLTNSEKDPAFVDFSANRVFSMHYSLTDANLEFNTTFENGTVKAGLGAPAGKADLTLKMKADIFDRMMTGKINAMGAAMSGKMKFTGDTGKAMQMQRIQKDMMRLYTEAREKVGDPGDLRQISTAVAQPPVQVAQPVKISPPVSAAPPPVVIHTADERDELVETVVELYEKNLITATGGNVSVRVEGSDAEVWITPSSMFKGSLRPELMVRIDMDGEALDDDAPSPSSERWLHTGILKVRPDVNAVIHAHSPWSTLLALSQTPFLPISTEAAFVGDIPRVPFIMPGTRELASAVVNALGEKGVAVLMQNHGLIVVGSSLRQAASTTEVIERCSELILRCLALGKQPPILPEDITQSLREMGQMIA
jgi:sugar (pentulose or hexulose) kinase/phosphoglycerate dehydrogenase-like enzyme/ribulose-5-phosphate 4-epimerase/fuculose-1-phosphate aldolase/putative sterol carrier protein